MYSIERTGYGFKLTFGGFIQAEEMQKWLDESKQQLQNVIGSFKILIDMRELKPLAEDAQKIMQEGQELYKEKGMERSCVILNNPITKMQFTRIAKETGIYDFERYIDSSASPDWMNKAMNWLTKEEDPDKK
jgi:hypothetical protein